MAVVNFWNMRSTERNTTNEGRNLRSLLNRQAGRDQHHGFRSSLANQPDRLFRQGFPREPTFRGIRSLIGSSCCASSSNAPAKPAGPKTRQRGFKRVLRRLIETAAKSGRKAFSNERRLRARKGSNPEVGGSLNSH